MRKLIAAAAVCVIALAPVQPAFAWSAPGHTYVGNLAQKLLNENAGQKVQDLLGTDGQGNPLSLGAAAVWPDCIRWYTRSKDGTYTYQGTEKACTIFASSPKEEPLMKDYASRNWINCKYAGKLAECHKAFHFDDVNVNTRAAYEEDVFGAPKTDVVRAIKAAITVLQCPEGQTCAYDSPINIASKREALFLLAHFVGDLHQPLHVGAVYLDKDSKAEGDAGAPTTGGNSLLPHSGDKSNNLHHYWDTIATSLGTNPTDKATIKAACGVGSVGGALLDRPGKWATDTIGQAKLAYQGMTYAPDSSLKGYWDISYSDQTKYNSDQAKMQAVQLIRGGAHLAEVLNAIWPSNQPVQACA